MFGMSKRIKVLLGRQVLLAYDGQTEKFKFDCVTGDSDHPTTPGHFTIFSKHRTYTSIKYKVPMDYAMFFTHDGKAIHKSNVVGPLSYLKWAGFSSVGSHGCVRLTEIDARTLFDWTPLGTAVDVTNE
jgi:lipoprotein-anchoring transpeptidase ErfK/SrfK